MRDSRRATAWWAFGVVSAYGRWIPGRLELVAGGAPMAGEDFRTYTIDWSPTEIVWSVDGRPYLRLIPDEPGQPLAVILNPMRFGMSPSMLVVDFVRVTTSSGPGPSASPTEASPTEASPTEASPTEASPTTTPTEASPTTTPPESPPTSEPTTPPTTPPTSEPTTSPTPTPTRSAAKPKIWKEFVKYAAGDLVKFKGTTYRVLEAHTSLPGWEPPNVPSVFEKV